MVDGTKFFVWSSDISGTNACDCHAVAAPIVVSLPLINGFINGILGITMPLVIFVYQPFTKV